MCGLELLVTSPAAGFSEADSGGFLEPMIGTLAVAVLALAVALPVGIGVGVWLSEYGAAHRAGPRRGVDDRNAGRHAVNRLRALRRPGLPEPDPGVRQL